MMHYRRAIALCIGLILVIFALITQVHPVQAVSANNGIVAPSADAVVNGAVAVEGVAYHPGFRKWQLDLLLDGDHAQTRFIAVGEQMAPQPAQLTQVDTTRYPNGKHLLRLRVVYTGLQYDEFYTPIVIRNSGSRLELPVAEGPDETEAASNTVEEPPAKPPAPAPEILVATDGVLAAGVPEGHRWVEVNVGEQTLTAWQGDTVVLKTKVSTGKPGWRTLPGKFNVYVKYNQTRMRGPGYDTPDVPWTMYYYQGFAIHGAYWHNNFGAPVSHGCVNLRVDEAKMLFDWADVGLEVVVVE
jgi:hypothetical protein